MKNRLCLNLALIFVTCSAEQNIDRDGDIFQRIQALENQQRESKSKFDSLERTIRLQSKIIKSQAQSIQTLEHVSANDRKQKQQTDRMLKYNALKIMAIQRLLRNCGCKNESENLELSKEIDTMTSHLTDRRRTNAQHNIRVRGTQPTDHSRIAKTGKDVSGISLEKKQETRGISFSAYLDHDVNLGEHQTIKFNQILINDGNGYSTHSGIFTCPETGVYMLVFVIGQRDEKDISHIQAELIVNSQNIIDAVADAFHQTQDLQGGNTVVTRLQQGDQVWIDSVYAGGHAEGSIGLKLTSFSGVYLYA